MSKNELTIIIPFVNEKYEVEETLKSIRDFSDNNVNVLLINDASDDHFDYKSVAQKYNAEYLENSERIGVAASRDRGVNACRTPYFLLLDAHMRFYDTLWLSRILEELRQDPHSLLCSQTKALMRSNGILAEDISRGVSYGASVKLDNPAKIFEPKWIIELPEAHSLQTIPIPCVLGAGYACSKEYWLYLKGLEGLQQYGNDEAYISIKIWMAGGSCKLLKDVEIGHIYRSLHPYPRNMTYRLYNKLFLSEIFLSAQEKKKNLAIMRLWFDKTNISEGLYMLDENSVLIAQLKKYYKKILIHDFSFFKSLNDPYKSRIKLLEDKDDVIKNIMEKIMNELPVQPGLLHGQMGVVLFLYHYAKKSGDENSWKVSDKMLKNIIKNITSDLSYCFISGLAGIGWGIEYLYQQGFIEVDINKMLKYIDRKMMEIDPLRIEDINKEYGLGGIVLYLQTRLFSIYHRSLDNPFDDLYLSQVYTRVKAIVDQRITDCNCMDVFLSFMRGYENKKQQEEASIYDASPLVNPKNIFLEDLELGLKGCAGVGLLLLLENN